MTDKFELGSISEADAVAVEIALQIAIDDGYFARPETYAAVIAFKARLRTLIAYAKEVS